MAKQYWLMKSEPDQFGIADLARVRTEPWSGVRNYMARNHMRAMQVGDEVLFHHSSVDPPGVAGLARVARTNVVDQTQFDPASPYYDPKSTRDKPTWDCVDVEYVTTLPHFVSLDRMRAEPALRDMMVLKRGMRLSVQPVTAAEYACVVALGNTPDLAPPPASKRAQTPKRAATITSRPAPRTPAKRIAKPSTPTRPREATKAPTKRVAAKPASRRAR